jgi:cellulose synthase (UDP-forming)
MVTGKPHDFKSAQVKIESLPSRKVSDEIRLTCLTLIFSAITSVMLGKDLFGRLSDLLPSRPLTDGLIQMTFISVVTFLLFANFTYQFARLGRLKRAISHCPTPRHELERIYTHKAPSVAVLVPSYQEDLKVVRKTLLSAALLDYPSKHVVLLIDNAPVPATAADQELLRATRALPLELQTMLNTLASRLETELDLFLERSNIGQLNVAAELKNVAALYDTCADWLDQRADDFTIEDHQDRWFVQNILRIPSQQHRERAQMLRATAKSPAAKQKSVPVASEYYRLSKLFRVEFTSFERKKYVNLSQEPNKAMNLNSYLDLMGHETREIQHDDGVHLIKTAASEGNHIIPDADFVITLDADTLLKPDYALRLVTVMEQPGNESLAVAQTPYSAFPETPNRLERTAGATTDIQYLVHQGLTNFNATFWVGANALLRKKALEEIATVGEERGYQVRRFIQDRTVIEDTESTVDLILHGWRLYNYPERLAYSATPPDFGSLLIQRRRWANGGLIILPKLLRYLSRRNVPHRTGHAVMGIHYLTSLATANIGVLLLLALPVEELMRTQWLPLAALPYSILYARDLVEIGYSWEDFFCVSVLSLLLLPINLGGVCKSIQQMILDHRVPFGRTPKVPHRTATPLLYLFATYGFSLFCIARFSVSLHSGHWLEAVYAGTNAALLVYGIMRFIGLRETCADLRAGLSWLAATQGRRCRETLMIKGVTIHR